MRSWRVGFATSEPHSALIDDDLLAARELERAGATVRPLVWTRGDTGEDLDAIVVRSCWDYHQKPEEFRAWLSRLRAPQVWNPAAVLAWNLDKHYLVELAARGVSIPRTRWLERGSRVDLARVLDEEGLREAVVKPTISLTAYKTFRVSRSDAHALQGGLDDILGSGDAMVQELLPEIFTEGELSFVFFDGVFSHVVEKRPKPGDFRVQSDFGGSRRKTFASAAAVERARDVFAGIDVLYARVDMVPRAEGLVLMELELLDPVLFFALEPEAPKRFVSALTKRIASLAVDRLRFV